MLIFKILIDDALARSRLREFTSRWNARRRTQSWGLLAAPYVALETWFMAMPKWFIEPTTLPKAAPSDRKPGCFIENPQTVPHLVLWRRRHLPEPNTLLQLPTPLLLEESNYESFLAVMNVTPSLTLLGIFSFQLWYLVFYYSLPYLIFY